MKTHPRQAPSRTEDAISRILKAGVESSLVLIVAGSLLSFILESAVEG